MDAMALARAAVEKTYTGVCDVIVYQSVKDPATGITSKAEKVLYKDKPCRLSYKYKHIHAVTPSETAAQVDQIVKLFVSPDTDIPVGSKIIVTQNGSTAAYRLSGQPMVYHSHAEIMLELYKEWC